MISGTVNSRHEIEIRLSVRDALGQDQPVNAILDTGFNGSLTLPPEWISRLGLPWRSRGSAYLANGSLEQFDIYLATIHWDGISRSVLVQEIASTPLLGMALLRGFDLRARVVNGGIVEIEAVR